nr:immunoglobulin heavy chain junction region [Mus musculus]
CARNYYGNLAWFAYW